MYNDFNDIFNIIKMQYILNNNNNILFTIFILFIPFLFNNIHFNKIILNFINYFTYYKKSSKIILEGKISFNSSEYTSKVDIIFSNRLKAIWYHINNTHNDSIYSLKEYFSASIDSERTNKFNDNDNNNNNNNNEMFVVNQNTYFNIDNDIYCYVYFYDYSSKYEKNKKNNNINIEKITIEIISNKYNVNYLTNYIDNLTNNYLSIVQNNRKNKIFIYTLIGNNKNYNDDNRYINNINNIWEECEFISTKNFNNIFFDNKLELIDKINFFNNNKSWYEKNGHPYTLGIGLSGSPGTGKTSVIKCIANMLNRHLIVISLNKIKTQSEFNKFFFEKTYNTKNINNSIDFSNKIIVLEDIDCMSDIVNKRTHFKYKSKSKSKSNSNSNSNSDSDSESDSDLNIKKKYFCKNCKYNNNDDKITLSYLLNIIDGIRETPGRILIITSNYYENLDDALVRPGRIDIKLEMKNTSINIICQLYHHYYNEILDTEFIEKLADNVISPANIINIYINSKNSDDFKSKLLKYF